MKESIIKNTTQILLIVFSVVLGLYLSERIEERKTEKEATKLLSKIKLEVNENRMLIEDWAPYHIEVLTKWDSISNDDKFLQKFTTDPTALYEDMFYRKTIIGRMPSNDAWDIAKSHPLIVNIDYDELFLLSKIYNQQSLTFNPFPSILELLRSPDFNNKENATYNLQKLKTLIEEIVGLELQLIKYFKQADEILQFQKEEKL